MWSLEFCAQSEEDGWVSESDQPVVNMSTHMHYIQKCSWSCQCKYVDSYVLHIKMFFSTIEHIRVVVLIIIIILKSEQCKPGESDWPNNSLKTQAPQYQDKAMKEEKEKIIEDKKGVSSLGQ